MEKIRAIIINPQERTITEQWITPVLSEFYRIIGCDYIEMYTAAPLLQQTDHFMYVDEEGLFKEHTNYFYLIGAPEAIKGTGIMMKRNDPEAASVEFTVEQLTNRVAFFSKEDLLKHHQKRNKKLEP